MTPEIELGKEECLTRLSTTAPTATCPTYDSPLDSAEIRRASRLRSLEDEDEEEEEGGKSKIKFAPLAVFCTFFVAELGDKTQLTAITFGANEGMGAAFIVWIGCSLGLFLADILGMLVGYLLKSKTPDGLLNTLAFVIFAIFGIYTAYQALNLISESVCPITVWPLLAAVTVAFVVICVWLYMKKKKGQDVSADKG